MTLVRPQLIPLAWLSKAMIKWTVLSTATAILAIASPRFFQPANLLNIIVQSSSVGLVAIGMTIVLLTGGIDLSVGSIMFLAAAVAGKMVLAERPTPVHIAVLAIVPIGLAFGAINGLLIARARMLPFVVTLATLYIGRGAALAITQTRAMNLPNGFLRIGQASVAGVPFPIMMFFITAILAHLLLTQTPLGLQLYAVGQDPAAARKAGIRNHRIIIVAYLMSGLCAALGGIVSVAQLGSVSPTFGYQREFTAVAAAVLGGTSLAGGRGKILPGTLLGALLIGAVENGLVTLNANPYIYPVVTGGVIFLAVLSDRRLGPQSRK